MRLRQVAAATFLAEFKTQYLLAATFMRLQEYYESPLRGFCGRYFTHEQYMDAYAAKYGNFTYTADWAGFNVPGNIVVRFFSLFRDLSRKETALHEAMLPVMERWGDRFYLVGSTSGDLGTLKHEVAHAFYYLDPEYKREMDTITARWPQADSFRKAVVRKGYRSSVVKDETQAYMATSPKAWLTKWSGLRLVIPPAYRSVFSAKYKGCR